MKHILFIHLGICLFSLQLKGQQFKGALISGLTLTQIDGDLLSGFNQPGFRGGFHLDSRMNDRWSLALELAFSQAGSRRQLTDAPGAVLQSVRLNQVEVPVMVQFTEWKFKVGAGFAYQRLINYKVRDISGADVTSFYPFRNNHLSFLTACTYRFNDRWGLVVSWSKSLHALQANRTTNKFTSRIIGVQTIIYL